MLLLALTACAAAPAPAVTIVVDTAHRIQTIRPIRAIGTAVDSDPKPYLNTIYKPSNVRVMLSTGLGTLTYRLYTELSIEDWHWNPAGRFSDAAHRQGYWTSSADAGPALIHDSFGYRLSHRGSSRDQGDDNDYSRIDDGDPTTYWKSNPYLTQRYTGEPDDVHPQWVAIQFLQPQSIDAIAIHWANPYATKFLVQYWTGNRDAILYPASGGWKTFERGTIDGTTVADGLIRLADVPVNTTFVRIWMTRSSGTCDTHGRSDPRNCVGYAMEDVALGHLDARGAFHDLIVRAKNGSCHGALVCLPDPKRQTLIWTSSDDAWHDETTKVGGDQDQPGLDLIVRSGLTRGLPTIYPVPVFYSTPLNAANEVRYLEARHYPLAYVEMGEEIDGQYALPEDYGALYIQFANAIHAVDRRVKLGGPVFQGVDADVQAWRDADGDVSWLHRFINYLKRRGHLGDLSFMSYEHYPFRNCDRGSVLSEDLLSEAALVHAMAQTWRNDGVPPRTPLLETEDNFSPDGTGASQRVYGALWTGDFIGSSLASGISYVTYYQAEPEPLDYNGRCRAWGAYNPYIVDKTFAVRARGAAYYALRLLTQQWALPGDRRHGVYPVTTSLGSSKPLVTAYALERPDGTWSVLVVNKDAVARSLKVEFEQNGVRKTFAGSVDVITFSEREYRWAGNGPADPPNPDRGLARSTLDSNASSFAVAPQSLTVFRGRIRANPP